MVRLGWLLSGLRLGPVPTPVAGVCFSFACRADATGRAGDHQGTREPDLRHLGELWVHGPRPTRSFQCRLDNAAFAPCGPEGVTYDHLALGPHCFEVLAVHGGLRSAPTSFCWRCRSVAVRGEFTIGGNTAQLFYPGTSQVLDLSITNPFKFAIKVLNVSITVDPSSTKSGCTGTVNLLVTEPLRATLAVPAESTKSLSQLGVPPEKWPVLTMPDLPVNQDACEGATFTLVYRGTAAQL